MFSANKRCTPRICDKNLDAPVFRVGPRLVLVCLAVNVTQRPVWRMRDPSKIGGHVSICLRKDRFVTEQLKLAGSGDLVGATERSGKLLVVTPDGIIRLDGLERSIGDAVIYKFRGRPDQCVAAFDVGVEERKGLSWVSASSQSDTFASSTAIGLTSTP